MNPKIKLTNDMKFKAHDYAVKSHDFTSRGHDFHEGGPDNASQKMNEGKLGERAFEAWLKQEGISFIPDSSNFDEADSYDFIINGYKVDVKTRVADVGAKKTRTLEMVEQFRTRPKDIYVGASYFTKTDTIEFYGFISAKKLEKLNPIENQGYKNNYVAYDKQLTPMSSFKELVVNRKR
jgi:hypothetical protein